MAAKLLIKQGGVTRELTAQENGSVQYKTQTNAHYELIDENGDVIHNYTTRVQNGKLLIDVTGTSANPDFILSDYTTYFPIPQNSGIGSGYFGDAAVENAVSSSVVKASTAGTSSGGGGMLLGGLLGLAAIGGLAALASGGSDDKDDATNNSGSQNNTSGNTNNNSGNQNNTGGNTNNNSGSQNNTSGNTNNNSGSQNNTSGNTNNNSGSQNNTDNNSNNTTNPSSDSPKDVLHGNSIKLPTAYTQKVLSGSDLGAITKAAAGGTAMNQYQSSEANKKIIIHDLNNLSREVQTELSLFVAGLLNPIRKKWNVGLLKVTNGAMDFAQDVANEYVAAGRSIFDGKKHYDAGIVKAAAKYGLNTGGNFYENMGGGFMGYKKSTLTLDDLKKSIYGTILQMLFDDAHSNHGHAKSLLNAMNFHGQDVDTDYLGIDTSQVVINSNSKDWGEFSIHFIQATDNNAYVINRAKFAATIQTPEITSMPTAPKPSARIVYLDDDNSHLSTTQLSDSDDQPAPITQKFTFSQLLDNNVRQLADEYDENDVLALSQKAFAALNKDVSNLHDHISYDSNTGLVSYDADGVSGSIAPVAFAQLAQGLQNEHIQFEII